MATETNRHHSRHAPVLVQFGRVAGCLATIAKPLTFQSPVSPEDQHLRALPVEMIATEADGAVLYAFLDLMHSGDTRPPKGRRSDHPTTPLVVAADNRLAQLNAPAYRKHRQQHPLAEPAGASPTRQQPAGCQIASHLSLF